MTRFLHAGYFVAFLAFVALETMALVRRKRGDTFSEWFWKTHPMYSVRWWASLGFTLGLLVWLIPHLWRF